MESLFLESVVGAVARSLDMFCQHAFLTVPITKRLRCFNCPEQMFAELRLQVGACVFANLCFFVFLDVENVCSMG